MQKKSMKINKYITLSSSTAAVKKDMIQTSSFVLLHKEKGSLHCLISENPKSGNNTNLNAICLTNHVDVHDTVNYVRMAGM